MNFRIATKPSTQCVLAIYISAIDCFSFLLFFSLGFQLSADTRILTVYLLYKNILPSDMLLYRTCILLLAARITWYGISLRIYKVSYYLQFDILAYNLFWKWKNKTKQKNTKCSNGSKSQALINTFLWFNILPIKIGHWVELSQT